MYVCVDEQCVCKAYKQEKGEKSDRENTHFVLQCHKKEYIYGWK